jgi:hypothetical protein
MESDLSPNFMSPLTVTEFPVLLAPPQATFIQQAVQGTPTYYGFPDLVAED